MKKFSTLISIMLIALALVSCKPDYTPVGADGFTTAQSTKIEELMDVENTLFELASQSPRPAGVEDPVQTNETKENAPFWIRLISKVNDNYTDATHPNIKYNMNLDSTTYFYKKNSSDFYTLDELVTDGYISQTGVVNSEKMRAELKMKMNMKDTLVYKDSTSGTPVNSILKYDVNVTAEGNQIVFLDGSLSIDLGDGKGAIGSNDKTQISSFFETPVTAE